MKQMILTLFIICCLLLSFSLRAEAADYLIRDYGAVSDTTQLSTEAVQRAIDDCHRAGGGRVVVSAGNYKVGSLVLRSHVNLHLEAGATIYGSTSLADYKPMRSSYVSLRTQTETVQLIYADNVDDVVIDGFGTIDGQGRAFPKLSWNDEGITRPHLLRFIQSRDVVVKDVTLKNSGCWMQHYLACDRLRIEGIKVRNRNNYNNDALDIDGCHDVVVRGMIADSDDDGITLKSTSPRCCENIRIADCVVSSHCNAVKLGTETNGGFRNINISGIVVKPSEDQTESPIFIRLGNRGRGYKEGQVIDNVGKIDGVRLHHIQVRNAGSMGCSITGLPGHPVENVCIDHVTIHHKGGVTEDQMQEIAQRVADEKEKEYPEATMWGNLPAKGFFVRHVRHIRFSDFEVTTIQPDCRPEIVNEDVEGR